MTVEGERASVKQQLHLQCIHLSISHSLNSSLKMSLYNIFSKTLKNANYTSQNTTKKRLF